MSDDILEKVRKLLAQAESAAATPQEAAAFNEKAAGLIAKYGIERAKLEATQPGRREEVADKIVKIQRPYTIDKISLLNTVALAMRCQVIKLRGDQAHLIGYPSDIERVETVYSSLLVQQAFGLGMAQVRKPMFEDPRTFAKSYFLGFQIAVKDRLQMAERRAAAEERSETPGTDLVLADRKTAVERRMTEIYPKLVNNNRRSPTGSGFGIGHNDGSRANLSTTSLGKRTRGSIGS